MEICESMGNINCNIQACAHVQDYSIRWTCINIILLFLNAQTNLTVCMISLPYILNLLIHRIRLTSLHKSLLNTHVCLHDKCTIKVLAEVPIGHILSD